FRGVFYFFHRDILSRKVVSDKPGTVQKATRNKSAKKQKGFQNQEHPTTQPKRNFIGDTERMLKKNHEIYQSLKNLLND
ncbi:hypothetical protein RFI41_12840, partial [Acinetobacter nosocomialis]|nr:hypothetical protein [Acinetobacter nosocomialis]